MNYSDTEVICVTPVKNEEWILERFLTLASEWADYIIIADQMSTDSTQEIARSFKKVVYIKNEYEFDECKRSTLLLEKAREITKKKKLVICLDADEALTPNCLSSKEWPMMVNCEPGTIFTFNWVNLLKENIDKALIFPNTPFAYIDDGTSDFSGGKTFHAKRIPNIVSPNIVDLDEIAVLHFQYLAWDRYYQKNAWYQVKDLLENVSPNWVAIFRSHHKHINITDESLNTLKQTWVSSSKIGSKDLYDVPDSGLSWMGKDLLNTFSQHGTDKFKKLFIWDFDWENHAKDAGYSNPERFKDPRSRFDKLLHRILKSTQNKDKSLLVRLIQKIISYL